MKIKLIKTFFLVVFTVQLLPAQVFPLQTAQAEASPGAVISVNTPDDEINSDGDCALREAIRAANMDSPVDACPAGIGADFILLPPGTYILSVIGIEENEALTGDLDITGDLTILGAGLEATIIDGNEIDRVFHILNPVTVNFLGLTIQNGFADDAGSGGGGGILNQDANGELVIEACVLKDNKARRVGGGLANAGTATITNSLLSGNQAVGSDVIFASGGGIFNVNSLSLENVSLIDNYSQDTGGAIDNNKQATLTNVTLSANSAAFGGGIFSDANLTVANSTLTNNSTGIENWGNASFKNSILSNSASGNNCTGNEVLSLGHNLDSGNSCLFSAAGDKTGLDPLLGLLQDNGGPTWTHALLPGSPAIDAGSSQDCPSTDQRGAARPSDGNHDGIQACDTGAYEFEAIFTNFTYLPLLRRP